MKTIRKIIAAALPLAAMAGCAAYEGTAVEETKATKIEKKGEEKKLEMMLSSEGPALRLDLPMFSSPTGNPLIYSVSGFDNVNAELKEGVTISQLQITAPINYKGTETIFLQGCTPTKACTSLAIESTFDNGDGLFKVYRLQ